MEVKAIELNNNQKVGILVSFKRNRRQYNLYYAFGAPEKERKAIFKQISAILDKKNHRNLYKKFVQLINGC